MRAVLVIDIPEKHLNFINAERGLKKVDIGYSYDEEEGWSYASYKLLALKPMPEKIEEGEDPNIKYGISEYAVGRNDVIDEIME